jgi:hypothetical protein
MNSKTRNAPPRAGAMLEALRGLGYSTAAAIADIIDNSVSAGATEVRVDFTWDKAASRISILDNGRGMNDAELESAMTLGDRNPLDTRAPDDLGRFGMGLKTASFSQCRRLTVATVRSGVGSCLRWDLDALAADPDGGWLLFEGPDPGSERFLDELSEGAAGTLVLWETLDRIVTTAYTADDYNDLIDRVEGHLAMVFHRLLQGPKARLLLLVNRRPVAPWDPFMVGHPAKPWESPLARTVTDAGTVEVQAHVLPHKDRLTTGEYEKAAGPNGWTAQQGFYIYRNSRLLVAGGWLGLGQGRAWNREEAHRLARIRVDLPNTADAAWKIDIRKSTARPPVSLRPWLTALADDTRTKARAVFAFRGAIGPRSPAVPVAQAWRVEHTKAGARYRIDEQHPAVAAMLEASGEHLPLLKAMLRVIGETVPVQRIWLDTAEGKETPRTGFAGSPPDAVAGVLQALYRDMVGRRGMSDESARRTLLATEPFHNYPDLVAALPAADPLQGLPER